jgi:hypothetical protein
VVKIEIERESEIDARPPVLPAQIVKGKAAMAVKDARKYVDKAKWPSLRFSFGASDPFWVRPAGSCRHVRLSSKPGHTSARFFFVPRVSENQLGPRRRAAGA